MNKIRVTQHVIAMVADVIPTQLQNVLADVNAMVADVNATYLQIC